MLDRKISDWEEPKPPAPTRYLLAEPALDPVMSPATGLLEFACRLGDRVEAGDVAGWVHDLEDPSRSPREVLFEAGGNYLRRNRGGQKLLLEHFEAGGSSRHSAIPRGCSAALTFICWQGKLGKRKLWYGRKATPEPV